VRMPDGCQSHRKQTTTIARCGAPDAPTQISSNRVNRSACAEKPECRACPRFPSRRSG
jgi:hypothetical protein